MHFYMSSLHQVIGDALSMDQNSEAEVKAPGDPPFIKLLPLIPMKC